jgi:hypothetical protein
MPLRLPEGPSRRRPAPIDFPLDQELRRLAHGHWPAHRLSNAPKDGRRVIPFELIASRAGKKDLQAILDLIRWYDTDAANFPLFEFP